MNLGGRLYSIDPALENPAGEAIELEVVPDTELKPVGDKGFGGYGEIMRFSFNDAGAVEEIRGASGMKLVPAERFTLPSKVIRPQ